jgi:hypothetical protein
MRSTTDDLLTWIVARLRSGGITVYATLAPQGAAYPFAVVELVNNSSGYTLGGESGNRVDTWSVQISSFDNHRLASSSIVDYDDLIGQLLENQFRVVQGSTTIINCDRVNVIGPMWLDHENYYSIVSKWSIRTHITGSGSTS